MNSSTSQPTHSSLISTTTTTTTNSNSNSTNSTQSKQNKLLVLLPNEPEDLNQSNSNWKRNDSNQSNINDRINSKLEKERWNSILNQEDDLVSGESNSNSNTSNSTASTINSSTQKTIVQSLYKQFLTGTGWFAPVVLPEPIQTREEREQEEKKRIDKLKLSSTNSGGRGRPGLRARASSGLEMMGWNSGGN